MPYVYSTMSNSVDYTEYRHEKDLNIPVRTVTVQGGANVPNKALVTPLGVATRISDEDLEFLKKHPVFIQHEKAGFIMVKEKRFNPEVVAADMKGRDRSAPYVPQDYINAKGPKPMEGIRENHMR